MMASSSTRAINPNELPFPLSARIQFLREKVDLTQHQLAKKANVPISLIEDIEAGLDVFLSPAVRQKLARVLKVPAQWLQLAEQPLVASPEPQIDAQNREELLWVALHQPSVPLQCPLCNQPLQSRVFERRDLDDNLLKEVKITCTKCLFHTQQTVGHTAMPQALGASLDDD